MPALTLSDLIAFRDNLIRALANDVREVVDHNGERVSYRSQREQAAALAHIESRIAAMQSSTVKTVRFQTSKG